MKRFLFCLLLSIPMISLAQSNFQKGYVVTNSKDTLRGYVDYKERTVTPSAFNFKTEAGIIQKYTLANCAAYSIDNMDAFERYEVDMTLSKIGSSELSNGPDLTTSRDTVFLKVVQAGKNITLFSYTDQIKERFYIIEKDSVSAVELIRQIYLKPEQSTTIVTDDRYLRQLLMVMRKVNGGESADEKNLLRIDYKIQDLKKIAALINGQVLVKSIYPRSRFFAGAGLTMSNVNYSGENTFANPNAQANNSFLPYITAGVDIFSNPAIRKLIFRAELSLFMGKYEVTSPTTSNYITNLKQSFNSYSGTLTPQVIYNVYNADRIKAFFGVGLGVNYSRYSNNVYEYTTTIGNTSKTYFSENSMDLEKFNFSLPFSVGAVLNKKVEIIAGYTLRSAITRYVYYSVGVERYRIGVNYLFGKH